MKQIFLHELKRAAESHKPKRYGERMRCIRISDNTWNAVADVPVSPTVDDLEFTAKMFVTPDGRTLLRWTIECEVIL